MKKREKLKRTKKEGWNNEGGRGNREKEGRKVRFDRTASSLYDALAMVASKPLMDNTRVFAFVAAGQGRMKKPFYG
ncbi:hypothetical protein L1049_002993 [Liquidambar formosana]|uniref:Uncharacterized protein n=1 Tax=Liquidambar formosana TaxID=63359 RepID=A0AAP0NH45_LIQFO